MKSMSEIMAEVNAQVAASRFTRIACGAAPGGDGPIRAEHIIRRRGICRDARRLGVSRMHLWAVLTGRRESNGLLQRYTTLKKQEGEAK